jgi:acetylornithine deacetylase
VVPVDGQDWAHPPFVLTRRGERLYGRGAADMKGFVACALAAAVRAAGKRLRAPLHLAFSYDEEVGCIGVRRLIDVLGDAPVRPAFCIVGEPTSMAVATGHKGKTALRAICIGREGHSALAPLSVNAVHLGCDFVGAIRARQAEIAESGKRDGDYDVPYSTLHVGRMSGGTALNIVPNRCEVEFEIRNLAADDPEWLVDGLRADAARIVEMARPQAAEADIRIEVENSYPGLGTPPDAEVVAFVKSLTGANGTTKVAFGTEGGLFSERLGIPTVVCGPGSMAQGHRPDEYVTEEQMARCDAMLDALLDRLAAGI